MTRISAAEYQSQKAPKRVNKYRNRKVVLDGITFDSAKEADRWSVLKILEAMGVISHLERQPKFKLTCGDRPVLIRSKGYPNGRQAIYTADFAYFNGDKRVVEDVKSKATRTEAYVLRKAIVEAMHPAVRIEEV